MSKIQDILNEMDDVLVETDSDKRRCASMYRKKLYNAYKEEHPEMDEEVIDDFVDEALDNWNEVTWSNSDWADYYGVDEDELEDALDSDDSLFD